MLDCTPIAAFSAPGVIVCLFCIVGKRSSKVAVCVRRKNKNNVTDMVVIRFQQLCLVILCVLADKAAFPKRLNKVDMLNSRDLSRYVNQVCCHPVCFLHMKKSHIHCKACS